MCGIVGYVGDRSCGELLMHGLERLEYRGYDSAGMSLLADGEIQSVRSVGNLSCLREAIDAESNGGGTALATRIAHATTGIGHTRWATHGKPSERNALMHLLLPSTLALFLAFVPMVLLTDVESGAGVWRSSNGLLAVIHGPLVSRADVVRRERPVRGGRLARDDVPPRTRRSGWHARRSRAPPAHRSP